tara:strand:+ start:205 stop:507 length:303 start_codon:yes stop_codon:yes gene_type:complete
MTPKYTNGKRTYRSELKLQKLKENRLEEYAKQLDRDIRGYDHIVQYADNHTASLHSNSVDDNIRTIIVKHNYKVNKVKKMLVRDFSKEEQEVVDNEIREL